MARKDSCKVRELGRGLEDKRRGGRYERIAKPTVPEVRGLLVRIGSEQPLPSASASASDRSDDSRAFVASDASSLESASYIP